MVKMRRGMVKVETNVVVPVELASVKEEFAARTIRPRIWKHAPGLLKPLQSVMPRVESALATATISSEMDSGLGE